MSLLLLLAACGDDTTTTDSAPVPATDSGTTATLSDSGTAPPTDSGGTTPPTDSGSTAPTGPCAEPSVAVDDKTVELVVGPLTRQYRLTLPATDAGTELAVIVAVHGADGRKAAYPQETEFDALGAEHGIITAYPLSELIPGNEGEWQLNTTDDRHHDIDFIAALLDDLESKHCVDTSRVYATGFSLGSMFTYELACQLSDRFAAIGSAAGTMPVEPDDCTVTDPVAVMHLHGGNDRLIAYGNTWDWKNWDEVGTMWDVPGLVDHWRTTYSCGQGDVTLEDYGQHENYWSCDGDVRVEHHRIDDLGHDWPRSIGGVSTPQLLWAFFSEFSR